MSAPALVVEGLSIGLADGRSLLRGLDLAVAAGETHCLVGESGSGKSLTALAIMGLLPPGVGVTGGRVLVDGVDVLTLPAAARRAMRGRRMAMIFQEPMTALNPVQTIGRQVGEMFAIHGGPTGAARERAVLDMLSDVRLADPERIAAAWPHQLSGGQRQRAMIAMALALRPALLIADEPTTALDVTTQAGVLALLSDLKARHGMAMLFITHDFGVVADIGDAVTVVHRGDPVEHGPARQVLRRPRSGAGRALLAAVPSLTPPPASAQARADGVPPLLSAEGMCKQYRQRAGWWRQRVQVAVDEVSLQVRAGEMLGIVGESGSGKSTLARLLLGLLPADSGVVRVAGDVVDPADRRQWRAVRRRMQPVFQDPASALNRRRRVADIIAQGLINFGTARPDALADVPRLLRLVGLEAEAGGRYPHQFSGGQRQRIAIARALAPGPSLLIADEAVSALDVSVQAQILALLRDLRDRLGLGVILITHDLRVAAGHCDRLMVMRHGRCVEEGETAAVFRAPADPYTRALLRAVPGQAFFREGAG